ncbi:MAG: LamG-like jellyroll fold domain-containing protein [Candidatus Omnitrophota bacterium]
MKNEISGCAAWCLLMVCVVLPASAQADNSPRIFSHIKTFANVSSPTSGQAIWSRAHFDLGISGQKILNQSLKYVSWSDLSQELGTYAEVYNMFDAAGIDFNDAFYHYSKDVYIPAVSADPASGLLRKSSMKEDRFYKILLFLSGPPFWRTGVDARWGSSLEFNGDDQQTVNLGQTINSLITRAVTFEAWIKPQSHISSTIFGWDSRNSLWIDGSGKLVAEINVDNQRQGAPRYVFPNFNQWYHIVGVGDAEAGTTRLYVNGNLIGTTAFSPGSITRNTGSLGIGSGFHGIIDDVRLYNRALSSNEIQQRYASNTQINNGLVGHWSFDEGQGNIIGDTSGLGHQAAISVRDVTSAAYGDNYNSSQALPQSTDVTFCFPQDTSLYIGHPWRFNEINVTLAHAAGIGWSAVWEYWDGTAWTGLTVNDGTLNMRQIGKIMFVPPGPWSKTSVNGNNLYWLRLRCVSAGTSGPAFRSTIVVSSQYQWQGTSGISGEKYSMVQVNGVDHELVPGWNPDNDKNQDGLVDDNEFAHLTDPAATARWKYRAIVPAWYLINRWVMNFGNTAYREYFVDKTLEIQAAAGVDGIYVDNAATAMPDFFGGSKTYLEYTVPATDFLRDSMASLAAIKQEMGVNPLIVNANSMPFYNPAIITPVDGFLSEGRITYSHSFYDTPDRLLAELGTIKSFARDGKIVVLHGQLDPLGWGGSQLLTMDRPKAVNRFGLYALARYYMTAFDNTYFCFQDPSHYATPWVDWFDAIGYDVGLPQGDFYIFSRIRDNYPNPPPVNILNNASFEDSNVVLSTGDSADWLARGLAGSVTISDTSEAGARALRIDADDSHTNYSTQYVYPRIKPNTTYTLSGWIKTENINSSNNFAAAIYIYGGVPDVAGTSTAGVSGGTHDWTFVSTIFKTGNNPGSGADLPHAARVYAVNRGTSGTAWFDDIRLEEGEYPLSLVLARNFTKALVLLRPMPYASTNDMGDTTSAALDLEGYYQPLNNDATLGPVTNTIAIKRFEGIILIRTAAGSGTPGPVNGLYGDVDGDSVISAGDALLAAQAATGLNPLTPLQTTRADVSGNGSVSMHDASLILQYVTGSRTKFPVEK